MLDLANDSVGRAGELVARPDGRHVRVYA